MERERDNCMHIKIYYKNNLMKAFIPSFLALCRSPVLERHLFLPQIDSVNQSYPIMEKQDFSNFYNETLHYFYNESYLIMER